MRNKNEGTQTVGGSTTSPSKHKAATIIAISLVSALSALIMYRRREAWMESLNAIFPFVRRNRTEESPPEKYKPPSWLLWVSGVLRILLLIGLITWSIVRKSWYEFAAMVVLALLVMLADFQIINLIRCVCGKPVIGSRSKKPELKPPAHPVDHRLTGSWVKIDKLSQSMTPAVSVLQLNGLAKQAVKLFKGVDISVEHGELEMTAFTLIPFMQASTEKYPLNGEVRKYPRRDLRKGKHMGSAQVEADGSVTLYAHWDPPSPGEAIDEFRLHGSDELHVTTSLKVGTRSCKYTVVYRRNGH